MLTNSKLEAEVARGYGAAGVAKAVFDANDDAIGSAGIAEAAEVGTAEGDSQRIEIAGSHFDRKRIVGADGARNNVIQRTASRPSPASIEISANEAAHNSTATSLPERA